MSFRVQRNQCATCIYRPDSPLDLAQLEGAIADGYGGFKGFRICHHSEDACCRGFWDRHKDKFALGQVAQRLDMVTFVRDDRHMAITNIVCEWCGRRTKRAPRHGRRTLRHKCPHGKWCLRADKLRQHDNHYPLGSGGDNWCGLCAQAYRAQELLARLRTDRRWAEITEPLDGQVRIEFGTIHTNGDRERALGYYLITTTGKVIETIGA